MAPALAEVPIPTELETTFRTHAGMVFRTAYRLTGNAADAEDVLQTVFLRLMRRGSSAAALESPQSYLRRASINVALDLIRERQRGAEAPIDDRPGGLSHNDAELRDCLRRALAKLDKRHAEMFALRFLEGHSNREIAQIMGMSATMVAVTIFRTRRKLQQEIRSYTQGGK